MIIKGEKSKFTVPKPGRHYLHPGVQVNIGHGTNQNRAPPDWTQGEGPYITPARFPPKARSRNRTLRSIAPTQTEGLSSQQGPGEGAEQLPHIEGEEINGEGRRDRKAWLLLLQSAELGQLADPRGSAGRNGGYLSVRLCWPPGGYEGCLLCRRYRLTPGDV